MSLSWDKNANFLSKIFCEDIHISQLRDFENWSFKSVNSFMPLQGIE